MTSPSARHVLAALAVLVAASLGSAQESRPGARVPATPLVPLESRAASRAKLADIYDTKADGKELVAAAIRKAVAQEKRVLVVFGGNWCGWCHKLHTFFAKNREVGTALRNEYEVVWIDTGHSDRNQDLVQSYAGKLEGVPYLVVLDTEGKVVTKQETGALEDGDHHDPTKVLAFLEKWRLPAKDAEKVLADGLAKAKAESKMVFFHVGAPWCGWCHKLEAFLAKEEVAGILAADFVMMKIDEDRMLHGKEVEGRIRTGERGGIPWTAFLDSEGKILVTSDAPTDKGPQNIGCPWEPNEIAWFMTMLRQVRNRITPEQLDRLEAVLKKFAEHAPASRPASRRS